MPIMQPTPPPAATEARFFAKVAKAGPDDCWEWTGARVRGGYGKFFSHKRRREDGAVSTILVPAHRWSYEFFVAPIPVGLEIDHLCRNKGCVNPAHLEPVTHAENNRRVPRADKCGRGHEFTPENTAYRNGVRDCRECKRIRARKAYARKAPAQARREASWTCPTCGATVRADSRRRHLATQHRAGEVAN